MDKKEFAPIPAEKVYDQHSPAMQEALQSKGFFTREITDGVYLLTEGWYHVVVVPTDKGTVVIDAPPSISPDFVTGQNLVPGIQEITDQPVTHLVYTHHHYDHIGGASNVTKAFPKAKIIAQEEAAVLLKDAGP